jgi:hypothetical protein
MRIHEAVDEIEYICLLFHRNETLVRSIAYNGGHLYIKYIDDDVETIHRRLIPFRIHVELRKLFYKRYTLW